jgi:hypothetical protein
MRGNASRTDNSLDSNKFASHGDELEVSLMHVQPRKRRAAPLLLRCSGAVPDHDPRRLSLVFRVITDSFLDHLQAIVLTTGRSAHPLMRLPLMSMVSGAI